MCYVIIVKGTRPEMQVKNEESISVKNIFHTFGKKIVCKLGFTKADILELAKLSNQKLSAVC